jgi:DNA-binding transcriptional MerR regulator
MPRESRHAIGELADLAGVSRRTVRYYVQEGLLPSPLGVGRGRHYGDEHLDRLLKVKALQEQGRTLDEIRRELSGGGVARPAARPRVEEEPALSREAWRRVVVAPGVELHVSARVRMPPPGKLQDLAAWCRQLFALHDEDEETDA